jgi:hemoglobin
MGIFFCKRRASLYSRLGGKPVLLTLTDNFFQTLLSTPEGSALFASVDMSFHKPVFAEFLCHATGGPEIYTGRDMKAAHSGLNLG